MRQRDEKMARLAGFIPTTAMIVDYSIQDIADIGRQRPGRVMEVKRLDSVRMVDIRGDGAIGCIAGWISEDDE